MAHCVAGLCDDGDLEARITELADELDASIVGLHTLSSMTGLRSLQ